MSSEFRIRHGDFDTFILWFHGYSWLTPALYSGSRWRTSKYLKQFRELDGEALLEFLENDESLLPEKEQLISVIVEAYI